MNDTQLIKELFLKSILSLKSASEKSGNLKKPYKTTPKHYAYGYPVLTHPNQHVDDTLDDFYKNNPTVAGAATGQLDGEKGEERAIILNPYHNSYNPNPDSKWFKTMTALEGSRHVMDEENFNPSFEITPEMQKVREERFPAEGSGKFYREDDDSYRKTMISRYVGGDHDSYPLPDTDDFHDDVAKVQKMMDERQNPSQAEVNDSSQKSGNK